MCYTDYIGIDEDSISRSGLYLTDLPGIDLATIDGLKKEDQATRGDFFNLITRRAWNNLVSDVSLALQDKFLVDTKLLARETSAFKVDANTGTGWAGVKIMFQLPKYARVHIISVTVKSEGDYPEASPGDLITIFDTDENGDVLHEADEALEEGTNTINVDQSFEADSLFVAYRPEDYTLKQTENKRFSGPYTYWDVVDCSFPCYSFGGYQGRVIQVKGGGLDIKYTVVCSVEKFVCENINLFRMALWYRMGVELADERLLGNRLNRFTTFTKERAEEQSGYFGTKYSDNIKEAVKSQNIREDPYCFTCNNTVKAKTIIP